MTICTQYIMNVLQQSSNFHSQLTSKFGRSALDHLRKIERKTIALAKWKNHLHFSLKCKRNTVFPVSLTINSTVKGARADAILLRAKKALLRERIRQNNMTISNIKKDISEATVNFTSIVDSETLSEAKDRIAQVENSTFNQTRQKQKKKFDRLLSIQTKKTECELVAKVSMTEVKETQDKWVVNASSKQLTDAHISILKKGLAHVPTATTVPVVDFIVAIESAAGMVGSETEEAAIIRTMSNRVIKNKRKPLIHNITPEERAALKDQKEDDSIVVLHADKGHAAVVMD